MAKPKKNQSRRVNNNYTLKGRSTNSSFTLKSLSERFNTLGSGNLYKAISVPKDIIKEATDHIKDANPGLSQTEAEAAGRIEAFNEWIAQNIYDFYNEIQLLFDLVREPFEKKLQDGPSDKGFPKGILFKLPGVSTENAVHYISDVLSLVQEVIEDPNIFPEGDDDEFPESFVENYIHEICKRLARIFAILFAQCQDNFEEMQASEHLNTCFKHFYYFTERYELIPDRKQELEAFTRNGKPLKRLKELATSYGKDKASYEEEANK